MMMAGATKIPEMSLSPDESKKLADAINNVNEHYNVALDPKVMAWVGLTTTCVAIYTPRVAAYKIRIAAETKKRKQEELHVNEGPQNGLQPDIDKLPMSNMGPVQ